MARQRKSQKPKPARADTDSEIEEIPRKTLVQQIEDRFPTLEPGVPFDIKKIKVPLSEALSSDSKDGVTFNEYDIPTGKVKRVKPDGDGKGSAAEDEEEDDEELIGDMGQTFFFAVPLTMLLFGFYCLVQKQYLEEPNYLSVLWRSIKSFFPIWFILYLTHPRRQWPIIQASYFVVAVGTGCWLVYNVNSHGYYAVMKMAPPLGTILVYSVIEMELIPAFFSVAAVAGYVYYNDFKIT
ncbi:hypothetical protein ABW19_dt0201997 [Dactylella cylindrospora]|nr:hypothetical protein ABW19_dt0201997 [Dactylella cylindrospora]